MSIGYACQIIGSDIYRIKGCTLKNATPENLRKIIEMNLNTLDKMIDYNIENGIKLFRISSDIIPFGSHPINRLEWWNEYKDFLNYIGSKIKNSNIRVSMHPGQYTILNSPKSQVVTNAIKDLEYHTLFLDALGMDSANKIILHIGGVYDSKNESIKRFIQNYCSLSPNIKERLVIENDEKCFNIEEVLDIGTALDIPVVFDNLHHSINKPEKELDNLEWIKICRRTWIEKDGRQKIHYSQQSLEGRQGSHSTTISLPQFLDYYNSIKEVSPDIMLEVKDKNISALKCSYSISHSVPVAFLEREWSRYKYLILSRSQNTYLQIRELLKDKENISAIAFYNLIEKGLNILPNTKEELNSIYHIWGYFKQISTQQEKEKLNSLISVYKQDQSKISTLRKFLYKLGIKYNISYIINSYYFYHVFHSTEI